MARLVLLFAALMGIATLAARATAQEESLEGQQVMTIHWNAEFKLEQKVVDRVDLGRVFRVDKVTGTWVHVLGKSGWISQRDVLPLEEALLHFNVELRSAKDAEKPIAYHNRGLALNGLEKFDEAISDFDTAIIASPKIASFYNSRAFAYHRKSEYDKALADYNKAIELEPKQASFLSNRGILYRDVKKYALAEKDFDTAIQLSPYLSLAYNAKAWMQSTCPDKDFLDAKSAIENAKRACNFTNWRDDIPIGTLAAAYARGGDFEQAQKWLKAAIQINPYRFQETRDEMKKQFDAKQAYTDE
jgi:tetratricopeptide (TPR) repeat protein